MDSVDSQDPWTVCCAYWHQDTVEVLYAVGLPWIGLVCPGHPTDFLGIFQAKSTSETCGFIPQTNRDPGSPILQLHVYTNAFLSEPALPLAI